MFPSSDFKKHLRTGNDLAKALHKFVVHDVLHVFLQNTSHE